jgi:hypothetical protein
MATRNAAATIKIVVNRSIGFPPEARSYGGLLQKSDRVRNWST